MSFETNMKWLKGLAVTFTFAAIGLAGGSLATAFNPSLQEYKEIALENDPSLLDRPNHPYLKDGHVIQAAVDMRTEDNLNQVGTGLGAGLAVGLLVAGAGALRRKPS